MKAIVKDVHKLCDSITINYEELKNDIGSALVENEFLASTLLPYLDSINVLIARVGACIDFVNKDKCAKIQKNAN